MERRMRPTKTVFEKAIDEMEIDITAAQVRDVFGHDLRPREPTMYRRRDRPLFEVQKGSPIFARGTCVESRKWNGTDLSVVGLQSNGVDGENPIDPAQLRPLTGAARRVLAAGRHHGASRHAGMAR
jgi:hypothetical protein